MELLPPDEHKVTRVTLRPRGPLVVAGDFEVLDEEGKVLEKQSQLSFCRCRLSQKFPYCDGSHKAMG